MRDLSLNPLHTAAPRSPTDGETRMFYEIVIAPGYTPEGLEVLKGKSKALRILEAKLRPPSGRSLRQVAAGWLYQVGRWGAMVCGGVCVSQWKQGAVWVYVFEGCRHSGSWSGVHVAQS
jgi:hypothetical protein